MNRPLAVALAAFALLAGAATPLPAAEAATWDGLSQIKSKRFDAVYLLPDADFRGYTKVMLDPTEVAFEKNWLRDYNGRAAGPRLSQADAQEMLDAVAEGFENTFRGAFSKAAFQVSETAGPDVVRVRTAVVNIRVAAPDQMTAGRSRTFSRDAGNASVIIEVRDSLTGALLGRAVDSRVVGDGAPFARSSISNRADFERLFEEWSKISVEGLEELQRQSPISTTVAAAP